MPVAVTYRIVLAALAMASLAGCEVLDPVKIHDGNTHEVSASVVLRPEALHSRGRGGAGGIEIGYERHLGEDLQQVGLGHYVSLDGRRISGPQLVRTEADIQHAHIAYNHLFSFGKHFQLEPAIGFSYDQTSVAVTGTAPVAASISERDEEGGVTFGVTPRWNFNRFIGLENRLRVGVGFNSSRLIIENPAIVIRPVSAVALNVGYLWYAQTIETSSDNSNAEISFRGPSVALRLAF